MQLGASVGASMDAKVGPNVSGTFAHDGKTPVGFAAGAKELGFDAGAVVADSDAEAAGGIDDFDFDLPGLGMADGVEHGFAGDQVDLVEDGGIEGFWGTHFENAQAGTVGGWELFVEVGEGLFESCRGSISRAKPFERCAALGDSLAHQVADAAEERLGGRIGREPALGNLELQGGAKKPLQESVVEFAGDTGALAAALFLKQRQFAAGFGPIGAQEIADPLGQLGNACRLV